MSHVVDIATTIHDLDCLRLACKELKISFKENQKKYKWWGKHEGDYALPAGFQESDLGKCEHAISVPGTAWEIGVVQARNPDGTPKDGFTFIYDFYGDDGRQLHKYSGKGCGLILQRYALLKAEKESKAKGLTTSRVYPKEGLISKAFKAMGIKRPGPGDIKLIIEGV